MAFKDALTHDNYPTAGPHPRPRKSKWLERFLPAKIEEQNSQRLFQNCFKIAQLLVFPASGKADNIEYSRKFWVRIPQLSRIVMQITSKETSCTHQILFSEQEKRFKI